MARFHLRAWNELWVRVEELLKVTLLAVGSLADFGQ
jgi:hypothetical protein